MSDEKQNYAELIRNLIPINELPPLTQNEFINKAGLIKVKKGKFVFNQGDRDEFSYYLLEGEIALIANDSQHNLISAGSDRARYAMAQLQPRQFSARANINSVILQINRNSLDQLLVLQDQKKPENNAVEEVVTSDIEVSDIGEEEDIDWMTRMLQSELFSRMPMTSIQGLFALLEPVELKAGDIVIKQGEPGEDYYIIASGACQVSRKPPSGGKDINLAVLKAGDSFGEEALITETVRNATISMLTDGTVMKLSKDNFIELIKKPALQSIKYEEAVRKVASGSAAWLDVRYKNEHDASGIAGSLNIPSNILRTQMEKLDRKKHYIVYCDTGGRSSTAVFLLLEEGFEASYLEGGLLHNTQAARKSEISAPPAVTPAKTPASATAPPEPEEEDDDPDIRASVLEAELARTNLQLESIEKVRKETVAAMSEQDMQAEIERRLKAERAQIEAAKRAAEEEAKRLRQFEEEKIRRMREEAEKRMGEEKVKLERVYSRNVEEMEKLERMKQESAEQLRRQKAQLDHEAEQARQNMEEAESIRRELERSRESMKAEALEKQKEQDAMQKKVQEEVMQKMAEAHRLREEVEEARRRLEAETEKKRQEQQQMELQIQTKAKEKLEVERRKLAEEFSRAHEEMEKAKREQAAAGAARKAAKEEAGRIIAEFKQKHDIDRKAEEERLRTERMKLEQEQHKLQEAQLAITKARAEAEAARRAAQEEAEKLHARHAVLDAETDRISRMKIEAEIAAAEVKLKQANREIEQAEMAEVETAAASQVNENDLMKQGLLEEELSKQLAEDLQEFRVEQEQQEKKFTSITSQMDHMRRIKGKAEAAKQAVKNSNANLLDEISAQLGSGDGR